ncbi:MAG: hypothetical protein IPM48_07820 [Saprospiraceae bacterium]|nr:hypothetical protein [Saprospiraceae bacterium]
MSGFLEMARLFKVEDICHKFLASYNYEERSLQVLDNFNKLCIENDLDNMTQIALIKNREKVVGWFGIEWIEEDDKEMAEVMEPINLEAIFSAETDILTVVEKVSTLKQNVFIVNKGNQLIGFFFYTDLLGNPLCLSILALLMAFEKSCLDICLINPKVNFNRLDKSARNNVMGKYFKMGFILKDNNEPIYSKTMEICSLKEKVEVVQENGTQI